MVDPKTGEVFLKKEHSKKINGVLLGSLSMNDPQEMFMGRVALCCRLVFLDPRSVRVKNTQVLRVTQKVWLNHEQILPTKE